MSLAGKEKEKRAESASSGSVTDVSGLPAIEDEDSEGKYEFYQMPGGTVYRICLLGNMFESFYVVFGLLTVVAGMFAAWAIHYAASPSREESEEDESGTDIDNPEKSSSKEEQRRTNSNESPDDSGIGTAAENSTGPESANQTRRRIGSDSESTHSSLDDFADAMDSVQHPDDYPVSYRLADEPSDTSRDQNMDDAVYRDQARDIVDQALDDAFEILDNEGKELLKGNDVAKTQNVSQPAPTDHAVDDVKLPGDVLVKDEWDSNSDLGVDEALDDAYAVLDMQNIEESPKNNTVKDENNLDKSYSVPVNEDVRLSLTSAEESIPQSSAILEDQDDRQEKPGQSEEGISEEKDITTLETSVEYVTVEQHDVPNAPVVKNAIDDDVVEDGSDDTTTSSDADTVKDAGGDVKAREKDLDRDERTEVENVVADLISNEMVKEWTCDSDDEIEHDKEERSDAGSVVADAISDDMVKDARGDIAAAEHDLPREEVLEGGNIVADRLANEMVNETRYDMDIPNEAFHGKVCENVNELVQPVDSQEVECMLGNSTNEVSDEAIYDENRVGVENVVADSLANEMILDILDELAIKDRSTLAADDSELPQTVVDEKAEEKLRSYRRVSDGPIPQIRIDSVDDDIVEEDSIPEDFASPQSVIRYETKNTSALPDGADDHSVPNDDEEFAKDTYKVSDYLPESDENQNQTKLNTQLPVDVNVTVSVRHDEEKQLENDFKSGAEVESDSDMHIVATVKTPHEDPTNVKDLLTKLTGEEILSVYAEDEGETDHDHKVGMVEFMATIGRTNVDDHGDKDDGEGIDIDQRSVVNEEFITSVAARQVECSNIDAFCFRPQEPSDMDNKNDADLSAPQDLGARQSDREESLDFQRTGSIINVQHEQRTEAAAPTNQDSDDQIVIASVTVPKTNVRDVLSSLVGEGYTEVEKKEDGDETADLRIEDFLLADVKMQHVVDSEHSDEHLHGKEPISENTVIPAPVSVDDSKDVDFLSSITGLNDQEQIPPDDKLEREVGPKILNKDDEVIVPRTAAAAEAGPELDLSNILSKIPQATPSTVTPIKEDDVVPTDVRKTVNGHVNLKSVLKSLGGELSLDIDLDDSDVSEPSPPRKRVITDAMVREAIQFLLQKPFLYSYGMYDSQDSLFYKSLLDDPILPGGRAFALVSNLVGKDLTPEQKSTLFALVSSPSKENLDDDDYPSDVDEPIFPDMQNEDEDEAKINFDELFASLERRPSEQDDQVNMSPKQVVTESYIADTREAMEEAVPESSERVPKGYPEVEDAVPERLRPDTISYSDDDSSSVSSSDTSGTYILDNQVGLVEEDEEEEQERPMFKEPRDPLDLPHHASRDLPGYQGYSHEPHQEEEEEEKKEEVSEKPQASRMFFITSAMLAQMAEQQNCDSSSDSNYERRGRQSDSPVSSSSEDYLEEIPPGYGPNSGSSWSQDPATTGYHQDDSVRSYPSEVPTAEYDNDNDMRFRPISGGESSLEPTPRFTTSYPLKDNQEIMHPSQNGHHVFSDYDSSSELLEIEKQRQRLFPSSPNDDNLLPQKTEKLQNGNTMESLHDQPLPIAEPVVTLKVNYPDETTPARVKDVFENGALNSGQPLAGDFQPIPEPTITRDMSVPEQVQPVFARSVFNQDLRDDDPRTNSTAQSHESLDSYPSRHPEQNLISGEYGKINGHTEPLSQSEDSMWSHSDYRGYSGSSEDGDYDDDTSFASGERMFALVGLPSNSPTAALSVTASIEVYRAEEHMEIQKSLYSYEISKGTAGPDGKMVKLQEQSFSFERRSDIVVESIDGRHEMTFSESVSESAGEQSLRPEEHSRNHPEDLSKEHPKELHEQSFASDHRSDTVEDLIDSPAEGFSMNETVTADFSSEQFVPPPAQTHDYHQEEFKLDLPFDSAGEELSEREGLQRQVESLSELLSERTLDMQRFKDDYPFLDRILSNPNETVPGYEEGQLIGLLETYRQLEEDVLELMNIYKETKTQLAELDQMERA